MTEDNKIWAADRRVCNYDCIVYIYEALKNLNLPPNFSMIDIMAGAGLIMDALARLFPESTATIVDARVYPSWRRLKSSINKKQITLQQFIKEDSSNYDVVMILDTYRMWGDEDPLKIAIDDWIKKHAKYFLTSAGRLLYEKMPIRGYDLGTGGSDTEKYKLELYKIH